MLIDHLGKRQYCVMGRIQSVKQPCNVSHGWRGMCHICHTHILSCDVSHYWQVIRNFCHNCYIHVMSCEVFRCVTLLASHLHTTSDKYKSVIVKVVVVVVVVVVW